jgi:membrane protein implicated in regulation of membrane protease activity
LRKLVAAAIGSIVLVGAFMLSVVLLAVVATVGAVAGAWLWWRTRELRKRVAEQMRTRAEQEEQARGRVIEGEVIRNGD